MTQELLTVASITKSFFGAKALSDVSLSFKAGQVVGLIGENGAGKSTLMNVIGGNVQPDSGQMFLSGQPYQPRNAGDATEARIGFIHQELNLFENLSIADNIFIVKFPQRTGIPFIDKRAMRKEAKALLTAVNLNMSPDTPVERLSPGERQLVEIAKVLSMDAQIIIFDEPTTSLTTRETEQLFNIIHKLRDEGKAIIYISHILGDVKALADEIAILRDGTLVTVGSNADFTINSMIANMVGRDIEHLYPPRSSEPTERVTFAAKHLSQSGIVKDINFELHQGEVLGMFGLMGSGRTELARILFGLDSFEAGEIIIGGEKMLHHSPKAAIAQGMAFVTENRREEGLYMEASIMENLGVVSLPTYTQSRFHVVDKARVAGDVAEVVESMHIKCGHPSQSLAKSLSGGNQQKVVIGKWLMSEPTVFLMDEPTRGIDVGAKFEVYSLINELAAQGTAVLFISSELDELIGNCDRILVMSNGEIQNSFSRTEFDPEQILRAAFRENGNHEK
ncbi:MAG: ABC transporter [Chloroflexi bacterium]|nr:MAG: ABC transporter [Chloroflexota bacterium]